MEKLKNASSVDEFLEIVDAADEEKPDLNDQLAAQTETEGSVCRIIAVTSCPTGIAHTYMAAEGLEKAAKSHNCSIKVETRGSGGAKNVLTDEEIANADCVIVAADAKVPMDRFDGKKLIEVPVSDGISKADQLVERAINGDAPIYHSSNAGSQSTASQESFRRNWSQIICTSDERCIPYASVCCRRWYSDCDCIPDRWNERRYQFTLRRYESKLWYDHTSSSSV